MKTRLTISTHSIHPETSSRYQKDMKTIENLSLQALASAVRLARTTAEAIFKFQVLSDSEFIHFNILTNIIDECYADKDREAALVLCYQFLREDEATKIRTQEWKALFPCLLD